MPTNKKLFPLQMLIHEHPNNKNLVRNQPAFEQKNINELLLAKGKRIELRDYKSRRAEFHFFLFPSHFCRRIRNNVLAIENSILPHFIPIRKQIIIGIIAIHADDRISILFSSVYSLENVILIMLISQLKKPSKEIELPIISISMFTI